MSHCLTSNDAAWKLLGDIYHNVSTPVLNTACIQQALSCKPRREVKLEDEDVVNCVRGTLKKW